MKAIILAGGKGTRLAPYTQILPKPLMPVGDTPILEILIQQLRQAGIKEVILTVGHLSRLIETYFADGAHLGVQISYSHEDKPLGTAGPLSLIEGLDDTFIVANGDVLSDIPLEELIAYHKAKGGMTTIAMYQREVKIDLGVIEHDADQQVTGYIEKPSYVFPVSMGVYVFEPGVLQYIPKNEYLDFPNLVLKLIEAGEKVFGYPFSGYWRDLGRPGDYEEAVKYYLERKLDFIQDEEA